MSNQGSYVIQKFSTTVATEIQRLKAQVELFWTKELKLYKLFGLKDGMAILECGSGPGYVMEKLLREFPLSHGVALEADPYLFEILNNNKELIEFKRCKMVKKSMMATGLPENSFDFALTRLVLEHLPDPAGAVREVYRVLKPGGKAVFIDNDFDIHLKTHPEISELDDLYNAYCKSRYNEGGNPKIGRELPGILKKSGFSNVDMEIVSAHSEIVGDRVFLKSEGVGISSQLVKDGYLSSKKLDTIAHKWYSLLKEDDHAFFRQLFMAVGEKKPNEYKEISKDGKTQKTQTKSENILPLGIEDDPDKIIKFLVEQVAGSLEIDKFEVKPDIPLNDIGFDSLSAVDLQDAIDSHLGIDISISNFFDGQTITDISRILLKKLSESTSSQPLPKNNNKQIDGKIDDTWEEGEI